MSRIPLSSQEAKPVVGLIGLGNMGNPMGMNLLGAGYRLVVHSRTMRGSENLIGGGATWAEIPADVGARVDVLITMLPGPTEVRQVMIGRGGALEQMKRGSTFIDMSTSSIDVARQVLVLAEPRGVSVMEAPVSGMVKGAIAGTLQIFVGAEPELFAQHLPLLRALGDPDKIFLVGPSGAGYAIKVLLNLLWFMHATATAEVLTMGAKAGVDLAILQKALSASPAQSNFLEHDINSVLKYGDYDDAFAMELVCKDLQLALALGADTGAEIELTKLVEQIHRRALQKYGPKAGEMSAIRLYEDGAGVQLRF